MSHYVDVLLPVPLPSLFTYSVPAEWVSRLAIGGRVLVPFGQKLHYTAIIIQIHTTAPEGYATKPIAEVIDTTPILLPQQYRLWQWIADYYLCTLGEVYKAAVPGKMKPKLTEDATPKHRRGRKKQAMDGDETPIRLHQLLPAQQQAYDEILKAFTQRNVCLLHGVTSSGKTEIYTHLIAQTLAAGKQVLYLLPEIALTTQITERLTHVFGERLGVYHSKFTEAAREAVWMRQLSDNPYQIILGVRSSVFLPFKALGLVIIDEEHENSFKQQDPAPRYHARSTAIVLATMCGAKTLLGTATPNVESYYNALQGKYALVTLTQRYLDLQLPSIAVVDVQDLTRRKQMKSPLSPPLLAAMREALAQHEQVILFQNRRGFAPMVTCNVCGWTPKCKNCDVGLTYHKGLRQLTCHYCGATETIPSRCPACESQDLRTLGYGTERIEDIVQQEFPTARVARMDLDTTRSRTAYEKIIHSFQMGETDILIGTQMVSKGLDFDRVRVVGILNADSMMNVPDFRAYERAYHLMAQVAGRAGRKHKQGRVFLQTRSVDLPIIRQTVTNDYAALYADQMEERTAFRYPPLYRLIYVYLKHRHETTAHLAADILAARLCSQLGERVLGPDKPAVGRVQQLYIKKIMIKMEPSLSIKWVRALLLEEQKQLLADERFRTLHLYYDVDPQ